MLAQVIFDYHATTRSERDCPNKDDN